MEENVKNLIRKNFIRLVRESDTNQILPYYDDISSCILLDTLKEIYEQNKMKAETIKNLSVKKIRNIEKNPENVCPICIDEFKENEYQKTLNCNHCFHKKCINRWLKKQKHCPLCRKNIN
jgi:hypothetical protein